MWESIKLGDVATFVNGYPFKPTDWKDSGLEIIRIQNLTKSSKDCNYFEGEIHEKYKVREGDILISWSATLGVYEWKGADSWLNQHIFKVIFDKKPIEKSFFVFLIEYVLDDLKNQVHGATMKHITKGNFDNTLVPIPPLSTQKAIAEKLDKADALRKKDQELLAQYDELAQAIFIDMFGDPVKNEKGWEMKTLDSFSMLSSGSTPSRDKDEFFEGSIPWVKTTEVKNEYIYDTSEKISSEAVKNSSCKLYPKASIIIAMYGQGKTRGQVGFLKIEATTNQACCVLQVDNSVDKVFLYQLLKLLYFELRELGRGGNQPNLNIGILKKYEVIVPSLDIQSQFAEKIQNIEAQKALVKQQAQQSEELFQALLQESFNF